MLRGRRANAHLLVKSNAWTSQRLLNWNPIPKLTIVLIWKTTACLKFVKTSHRAVENLPQRKLWVWAANDARFHRVFIWVVRGAIPWVPEVFLSCGGNLRCWPKPLFARVTIKTWEKPETALEKSLAPRVVARCILVKGTAVHSAWLNAMHSGKKWWIRELVPPYIFPLNPDYVAARSLRRSAAIRGDEFITFYQNT